jgi:gluconokinase
MPPLDLPPDAQILAIDIGSSSVRAVICDACAGMQPETFVQLPYEPITTPDGGVMIDPEALFALFIACIDQATANRDPIRPPRAPVNAVVIDTLVSNLVGMDAHSQPTTPIYTWADGRGADQRQGLAARLDPAAYHERTGCYLHTSYWTLRLAWLAAHDEATFRRTRQWTSLGEYILGRLFDEQRISTSVAAWSGLLNRFTLDWDAPTLAALDLTPERLPTLSAEPFGTLKDEWAARWPALRGAIWALPIGDGVASNLGTGCTTPDHVAVALGTSGAVRIIMPGTPEHIPPGLFCYRIDAGRSLVGGSLSNVGNFYQWALRIFRLDHVDEDDLQQRLGQVAPDSHGLTVVPSLTAERAPFWNPAIRAAFVGMTLNTTPLHLLRAGLEAIALQYARISERLRPLLPPDPVFIASGAATERSPVLMQILADALGSPVHTTTEAEASIRGAVLMATGCEPPFASYHRYQPNATHHAAYLGAMRRQEALINGLL